MNMQTIAVKPGEGRSISLGNGILKIFAPYTFSRSQGHERRSVGAVSVASIWSA